jgi:hypothetical protein
MDSNTANNNAKPADIRENTAAIGENTATDSMNTDPLDVHADASDINTDPADIYTDAFNKDISSFNTATKRSVFKWGGLSGSTLKIIAMVTMMIDHFAASVIVGMLQYQVHDQGSYNTLLNEYNVMRNIGRVAFPIFCFLLVEGYHYTRNAWKYAIRLSIFAIISEIPFDLALFNRVVDFSHQNVFFTLLIGLLTVKCMDLLWQKYQNSFAGWTASAGVIILGAVAADLLGTDYGSRGVLCIVIFYIFRNSRLWQVAAGNIAYVNMLNEPTATFAFLPIAAYNGKRGLKLKYVFYAFYPAHVLIFYLISFLTGGRG